MNVLFIYNPYAGQVQIKNYLWDIINTFSNCGYKLTVKATTGRLDAMDTIAEIGKDYSLIVVSGGDGTLNEALNGYMQIEESKRPAIGYIPAGSTNDYAASLKLDKDMAIAAERITKGEPHYYDVGKFNNSYFVYCAAFGLFTEVVYTTPQDVKNVLGHLAYVLEGVKSLASIKTYKISVKTENEQFEDDYMFGMITNTLSVGGVYDFKGRDVDLSDGLFEVILVKKPENLIELNSITSYLLDFTKESDCVKSFKTSQLKIVTKDIVTWTLDGEYGGSPLNITIENLQQKLRIVK